MTAVWWVNQKEPQYAIDLKRGYRWSPSRTRSGGIREAWRCLEDMVPGDVWLNWEQQSIVAIGSVTALPEAYEWPTDQSAEQWPDAGGIRVFFDHFPLERPIRADEIPDQWKRKAGPFRSNLWVKLSSVEPVDPAAADELRRMFSDRWPAASAWGSPSVASDAHSTTRFWLNVHTPESWSRFLTGDIGVITSMARLEAIRPGDIFIDYVSGSGGRWVSASEVLSEVRPAEARPYEGYDSQWEWKVRPLTARLPLERATVVRDTVGQLAMFRGHEDNWGVRVRRSGTEIPEGDAELIIGWIERASEGMA